MTSTATPKRNDVIRFVPVCKRNRINVFVTGTSNVGGSTFVHGFRCTTEGCIDSQAQENAWMVGDFEVIA